MRARDLAQPFPVVDLDTDALQAAAAMGASKLPGMIVRDGDGSVYTVVPEWQVLRFVIPTYVQDDPHLARVYDEQAAEEFARRLSGVSVREMLPKRGPHRDQPVVDGDDTVIEIAAVMAAARSPMAAVTEHGNILGVIRIGNLLARLLPEESLRAAEPPR